MTAVFARPRPAAPAGDRSSAWRRTTLPNLLLFLLTVGPIATVLFDEGEMPGGVRGRAAVLWILCLLPAWLYLRMPASRRPPIPFLPLIGVSFALYQVVTAVLGVANAADLTLQYTTTPLDPLEDYNKPLELLFNGWIALLLGYVVTGMLSRTPRRTFAVTVPLSTVAIRLWGLRLLWGGLAAEALRQASNVPALVAGLLNFASSLALFGGGLLVILATRRQLSTRDRLALHVGLAVVLLLRIGSGSLASVLIALTTVLLAVWVAGGRVTLRWMIVGAVGLVSIVSLRGVAIEYRRQAWHNEEQLPLQDRSVLMFSLLADKVEVMGVQGAVVDGFRTVVGRSANLDLLADVVRQTPDWIPYWGGETYLSLVGLAVPRVFWPNKPTKTLGQDFGHRYRYLSLNDRSTSVNLPFFIEFYANFGELGVLLGMLLVGAIYRVLESFLNRPGQHVLTSVCGLTLLTPLVNVESDFSLVFGGLLLNGVALWIVLQALQRTSRSATPSANGARRQPVEREPRTASRLTPGQLGEA